MNIRPLAADELPEIVALLTANGLPTSDLDRGAAHFLGIRDGRGLEGIVAIERYGDAGLLRSLAVRSDRRGSGLGSAMVLETERLAAAQGIASLYLLTTTAAEFFGARGYERLERGEAPVAIRGSTEFANICPSSAVFLRKRLTSPTAESGA
jgi:amino-acid N-acetyltransferase